MKIWKNYVGFQPIKSLGESPAAFVFYLQFKGATKHGTKDEMGDPQVAHLQLQVNKGLVAAEDFIYDKDSIGDAVEQMMFTFPAAEDKLHGDTMDQLRLNRTRNRIANASRRGVGNHEFDTDTHKVVLYGGSSVADFPIIVAEADGKYAIFKHPDFDNYGRVMEKL